MSENQSGSSQGATIARICAEAVESSFDESQKRKTETVGIFSISGKAKYTKDFAYWFARITSGMTIAEACAVVTTSPLLMKNITSICDEINKAPENVNSDIPALSVRFNIKGIKETLDRTDLNLPINSLKEDLDETEEEDTIG